MIEKRNWGRNESAHERNRSTKKGNGNKKKEKNCTKATARKKNMARRG